MLPFDLEFLKPLRRRREFSGAGAEEKRLTRPGCILSLEQRREAGPPEVRVAREGFAAAFVRHDHAPAPTPAPSDRRGSPFPVTTRSYRIAAGSTYRIWSSSDGDCAL
jgi:hypothetical protein